MTKSIILGLVLTLVFTALYTYKSSDSLGAKEPFGGWIHSTELGGAVYTNTTGLSGAVYEPFEAESSLITNRSEFTPTQLQKLLEVIVGSVKDKTLADKLSQQLNTNGGVLQKWMDMRKNENAIIQSSKQPAIRSLLDTLRFQLPSMSEFVKSRSDAELLFMLMMTMQTP